ncbi:uncharacterized protein N0V89_006249 [Didymosphaeria variabile]|uniref:PAC domain-containing protein n=1 Tax=Didymosphaeria variabile TaxID=1932322 RepID=A0A9W8XQ13_9PLEO|nr:uncharacterized protein N0V89_006249 [Didymosphaeria variabile]KAJ4354512.1 hypothetical protein N0V89_006249 [Didymosphaeria variabile]
MAPLMDQRGNVRYYVGAQIDITRLLEGGKGLESFKQLLDQEKEAANMADFTENKPSLRMLRELGGLLNEEEADVVRQRNVRVRRGSTSSSASTSTRTAASTGRRFIGMEETSDDNLWPARRYGPEGRLPGVYQNYLLVRPYPSLRILFTSPTLRIPGLSQSRLMDRIGGPQYVREGLMEALAQGSSVTAKVSWLTQNLRSHSADTTTSTPDPQAYLESRPRWIHCTPLLGSDSKPGVYMIVMVDKEEITGTLNARQNAVPPVVRSRDLTREAGLYREASTGTSAARFTSTKLYADYLRREGTVSENSSYTRRGTPNANRASLEEDVRLGKVNSGLARMGLSDEGRPGSSAASRSQSRARNDAEQPELRHAHNFPMGVGPPTPYRKRSPATELDI